MKHRVKHNQLGRNTKQAKALYRGLVADVLSRGRVETTLAKAKAVSGLVDKIMNFGKANNINSRRLVVKSLGSDLLVNRLFTEIAPNFGNRNSGYTRIIKLGQRLSDGAEKVILELVEQTPVESKAVEKKEEPAKNEVKKAKLPKKPKSPK